MINRDISIFSSPLSDRLFASDESGLGLSIFIVDLQPVSPKIRPSKRQNRAPLLLVLSHLVKRLHGAEGAFFWDRSIRDPLKGCDRWNVRLKIANRASTLPIPPRRLVPALFSQSHLLDGPLLACHRQRAFECLSALVCSGQLMSTQVTKLRTKTDTGGFNLSLSVQNKASVACVTGCGRDETRIAFLISMGIPEKTRHAAHHSPSLRHLHYLHKSVAVSNNCTLKDPADGKAEKR